MCSTAAIKSVAMLRWALELRGDTDAKQALSWKKAHWRKRYSDEPLQDPSTFLSAQHFIWADPVQAASTVTVAWPEGADGGQTLQGASPEGSGVCQGNSCQAQLLGRELLLGKSVAFIPTVLSPNPRRLCHSTSYEGWKVLAEPRLQLVSPRRGTTAAGLGRSLSKAAAEDWEKRKIKQSQKGVILHQNRWSCLQTSTCWNNIGLWFPLLLLLRSSQPLSSHRPQSGAAGLQSLTVKQEKAPGRYCSCIQGWRQKHPMYWVFLKPFMN